LGEAHQSSSQRTAFVAVGNNQRPKKKVAFTKFGEKVSEKTKAMQPSVQIQRHDGRNEIIIDLMTI